MKRITALTLAAALWILSCGTALWAQQPGEYQVKAAYLYKFGKFVEWPAGSGARQNESFLVCVLGRDPFGPTLESIFAKENIGGRSVLARRIGKAADASGCSILYVSVSESSHIKDVLTVVDKSGVLTVSDIPQFSKIGGMIQFVLEGSRVRFEINRTKAEDAGLTISSDLLKVASIVRVNP